MSKELRQKISEAKKGRSNGRLGYKHSEETKQKIKESNMSNGYKHSEETKQKMRGRIRSEETRKRHGDLLRGRPWSEARRLAENDRKNKGK